MVRLFLFTAALVLALVCIQQQKQLEGLQLELATLKDQYNVLELAAANNQGAVLGYQRATLARQSILDTFLVDNHQRLAELHKEIEIKNHRIISLEQGHLLTVTAYSPEPGQTDDTPFVTASNSRVREGIIAVSPDLYAQGWKFGRKVYVKDLGVFTIEDLMAPRLTNTIDIFMFSTSRAMTFGKKKMRVYLLGA